MLRNLALLVGCATIVAPAWSDDPPERDAVVTFVFEHGAAKSVLAAALFNQVATERRIHLRAVARGISPSATLQPETVAGLRGDGITVAQSAPQAVTVEDEQASLRVVTIDVAVEPALVRTAALREWDGVPAVSKDYAAARDDLRRRIDALLDELQGASP